MVIICTNYDGQESQMLHTKLFIMEIGPLVPVKIFEGFLPNMGMAAIMFINFHFHVPNS